MHEGKNVEINFRPLPDKHRVKLSTAQYGITIEYITVSENIHRQDCAPWITKVIFYSYLVILKFSCSNISIGGILKSFIHNTFVRCSKI